MFVAVMVNVTIWPTVPTVTVATLVTVRSSRPPTVELTEAVLFDTPASGVALLAVAELVTAPRNDASMMPRTMMVTVAPTATSPNVHVTAMPVAPLASVH